MICMGKVGDLLKRLLKVHDDKHKVTWGAG